MRRIYNANQYPFALLTLINIDIFIDDARRSVVSESKAMLICRVYNSFSAEHSCKALPDCLFAGSVFNDS